MEYQINIIENKIIAEKMLNSENIEDIVNGIIGSINGIKEQDWLEKMCINKIFHENFYVSKSALYGISDIARIYKNLLNKELIYSIFDKIKDDNLIYILKEVKDDLNIYLK